MIKKNLAIIALSSLAAVHAHALPSLGAIANAVTPSSSASGGGADAGAMQDQLSAAYGAAGKEVLLAQVNLAQAVGLKEVAAQAQATADALTSGATKDSLQEADKVQSEASKAIEAALKDGNTRMDAAGKAAYAEGMKHLGLGMLRYVGLRSNVMAFKDAAQAQLTSASIMDKMSLGSKLSTGTYIATELPGHVSRLSSTLQAATAYAKSHDIPVPKDATAALSSKF